MNKLLNLVLLKTKISHKITVALLGVATIPLLIVSILSFVSARAAFKQQKINELSTIADLKVDKIDIFFETLTKDMHISQDFFNVKANLPVLIENIDDKTNPEYIKVKEALDGQVKTFAREKGFLDFLLLDLKGTLVYSTEFTHPDEQVGLPFKGVYSNADYLNIDDIGFSEIFSSEYTKQGFEMLVAGPAFDLEGERIGTIVFPVDMGPVYESILDTTGLGETGETFLGKKTAAHVEHSVGSHESDLAHDHVFFLSPLRYDPSAALIRVIPLGSDEAIPTQKAAQGINGAGVSIDYRGKKVIAAWRYLPEQDWGLVAKKDVSEAFSFFNSFRNQVVILGVVLVLVIIILARFLASSISNPLKKASEAAKHIGKGDFSSRINVDSKDELGLLARAFNQMADGLENSQKELKGKILQLEKFNKLVVGRELKMSQLKKEINNLKLKLGESKKDV